MIDVDRLLEAGFFRNVPPIRLAEVVAETRSRDFAFASDDAHRLFHADAEDLAEQGVRDFLGTVVPFLMKEGVQARVEFRPMPSRTHSGSEPALIGPDGWLDPDGPLPRVENLSVSVRAGDPLSAVTERAQDDGYVVLIGERAWAVWNESNAEDSWTAATTCTLALLNALLTGHGSRERAFALYGGNDLHVAFVTPEQAAIINAASVSNEQLHDGTLG